MGTCVNKPQGDGQHISYLLSSLNVCSRRGMSEQEGGVAHSLRQKTVERREPQKIRQ